MASATGCQLYAIIPLGLGLKNPRLTISLIVIKVNQPIRTLSLQLLNHVYKVSYMILSGYSHIDHIKFSCPKCNDLPCTSYGCCVECGQVHFMWNLNYVELTT